MTPDQPDPSGRSSDSLPEGAGDAGEDIAADGRSTTDSGVLQGDEAVQEDEAGDGI